MRIAIQNSFGQVWEGILPELLSPVFTLPFRVYICVFVNIDVYL